MVEVLNPAVFDNIHAELHKLFDVVAERARVGGDVIFFQIGRYMIYFRYLADIALLIFYYVLIGLMQLDTRCSDGSCQAQEDLIAGFSAIEAEAELVQVRLKLRAATVIRAKQKRFQVADGFVKPMQVARFILFRVQFHARQVPIASVAVAFDFCTCGNSFADDLLKCFARDVFHDLHPREQSRAIFRF